MIKYIILKLKKKRKEKKNESRNNYVDWEISNHNGNKGWAREGIKIKMELNPTLEFHLWLDYIIHVMVCWFHDNYSPPHSYKWKIVFKVTSIIILTI